MKDDPGPVAALRSAPPDVRARYPKAELLPRLLARTLDLIVACLPAALRPGPGTAAAILYLLFADGLLRGQSPGKRLVGIKVVHLPTRHDASFRESALRNLPLALGGLLALVAPRSLRTVAGAGLAVFAYEAYRVWSDPLGMRLGDGMAETQVIDGKVVVGELAAAGAGHASLGAPGGADRLRRRWGRRGDHAARVKRS